MKLKLITVKSCLTIFLQAGETWEKIATINQYVFLFTQITRQEHLLTWLEKDLVYPSKLLLDMYYSVFAEVAKFPGFIWSCTVYSRGSLFIINLQLKIGKWGQTKNPKVTNILAWNKSM